MEPVDKKKKDPFVQLPGGLPVPSKLFTSVAQGILSGRKQAALDRAAQKGGMFAPGLGMGAETVSGDERALAAGEFAEAQKGVQDRPVTPAAQMAMERAGQGDWEGTFNAILSDPVGSLGFLAAESTARNPMATVLGVVPLAGTIIGSFEAEKRAGITQGITDRMQERGLDPTNPEDVFTALSDKELLNESFQKAQAGAQALSGTEALIEALAGPLAGDIARPLLRSAARLGSEVAGEAAGETARQVVTGEDVNLVEATLEGLSTVGQSVATTVGSEAVQQITKDATDQARELPTPAEGTPGDPAFEQQRLQEKQETSEKVLQGEAPPEDAFSDFFAQGIRINRLVEPTEEPTVSGEAEVEPGVRKAAEAAVQSLIREQHRIARTTTPHDDPAKTAVRKISNRMPQDVTSFAASWDASGNVKAAERAEKAVQDNPEVREKLTSSLREAFGDEITVYRGGRVESRLQGWSLSPIISQRFAEGELSQSTFVDKPGRRPVQQAKVRPEDVAFIGNTGELELVIDGSSLYDVQPTSLQELKDDLIESLNMLGMNDLAQDLGAVSDPAARGRQVPIVTRTEGEKKQTTGSEAASMMQAHVEKVAKQFPESELGEGQQKAVWTIPGESVTASSELKGPDGQVIATIEPSEDIFGVPTWVLYTEDGAAIEEISQDMTGAVQELQQIGQRYFEEVVAPDLAPTHNLLEEGEALEIDTPGGELGQEFVSKIRIDPSPTPGRYTVTVLEGKMKGGSWGRPEEELYAFLEDAFGVNPAEVFPEGISAPGVQARGVDINRLFGPGATPEGPGQNTEGEIADQEARVLPPPSDEELSQYTGSSRAIVERSRRIYGLEDLPEAQTRGWRTDTRIAIQKKVPERALSLAQGLISHPRPLFSWEVAGMTFRKAQLEQQHDEEMARAEQLIDMGQAGPAQVHKDRADAALAEIDIIERGVQRGGTESARATAAFGAGYRRPDMSLANIRRSVKARKERPLNQKEEAQIREVYNKLQRAEENLKKAQAKADAKEQEILQGLAKKVALANKPKEKPKGQRLEEIRARREEVKKQIRSLGYRANNALGASAELTYLAGKLALTYMEEGLVNLDSLVNKLMTDLPDLTREAAYEAIASQSPEVQKEARQSAEQKAEDFRKQQEIFEDFNRLQAEDPDKAKKVLNELQNKAYQQEDDNDRLTQIEQKIFSLKERLANVQAIEPELGEQRPEEEVQLLEELRELRTLFNLEQKIANLEDQIATGRFHEPVRRRTPPNTPEIQNAKIRLMKAKGEVRKLTRGPAEFELKDIIFEPVRTMRELVVTGEMSSVLRQGLGLILTKPEALPEAYATAFKAFFREDVADHIDLMMHESVFHPIRQEAGLELTFREGLNSREEVFTSKLLQRTPALRELVESNHSALRKTALAGPAFIKTIVNASERHWTTFLNMMRASIFDEYVAQHPDADMETLQQLAKMINALSGRGNLPLGAGSIANLVFFAPRYAVSRVEAPIRAAKLLNDKELRGLAAAGFLRTAAWGGAWLGLASLAGIDIGWDPRDSDFGKIVWGNTRIDIWGGFQQPYSTLLRLALAGKDARDPEFEGRRLDGYDLLTRFSLYKASPAVTFPMALITGEDVVGNEVSTLGAIGQHTFPLFLQDTWETGKRTGVLGALGAAAGVGHGLSISTFGSQLKSGDVKPILSRANYNPRLILPEETREDPERVERLEFTFGAILAKKIRDNKETLKVIPPEIAKERMQGYAADARAAMADIIGSPALPERFIEEVEEEQGVTP